MRIPGVAFYPAATSNYTRGRSKPIRKLTIHHSAGWEATLRYLWGDPNRNGSSTFWVGNVPGAIEQYVDTDDTPWTNGNFDSNSESLTVETRGDWRNGYFDRGTLDNLYNLMLKLLPHWPHLVLEFHMDVSRTVTLCPADLKHKGYARAEFDRAIRDLFAPKPTPAPAPPMINYEKIAPKRVKLNKIANLWNFNFTNWSSAKPAINPKTGQPVVHGVGHVIDVVAIATNALGGKYYMTAYSYDEGRIRATNGFNIKDCEDYHPVITQPPTVEPKWEPMLTPRKMRLTTESRVTDLTTKAEIGDSIAAGTDISLVELKTVAPGKVYARSSWAKTNNKDWGMPLERFMEVPVTVPVPEPPREPIPEPPIDVDPTTPGSGDIEVQLGIIEAAIAAIKKILGRK